MPIVKKKKPEVHYNPIAGSAPLSISWFDGPKGDAVEAKNEIGVGFFSPSGDLLMIEFDDVEEKKDQQHLEFDRYRAEIIVNKGKVDYSLKELPKKTAMKSKRSASRNKAT
jgi:hypothetical protein